MGREFERSMKDRAARDELLSAYLDDQLDAGDRARLEAQLAIDPALRAELEALRHTVVLVRSRSRVTLFCLRRWCPARALHRQCARGDAGWLHS